MKIISYNLNGIRAAINKGFLDWLGTEPADVICIQETKAQRDQIDFSKLHEMGYEDFWFSAEKKGYSGVAVFTKKKPIKVSMGNGFSQSDMEGRVINVEFEQFILVNAYFPSGTSGDERQAYKYIWLDEMMTYLNSLKKKQKNIVLVGDYNIAHTEVDIHDPKGNKKSSGFLPEERDWMTQFLESGWVDTFRFKNPDTKSMYSWWSQRFPSVRLQNKGWRIDYICVTKPMEGMIKAATIYPDVKHSDHCPVFIELNLKG